MNNLKDKTKLVYEYILECIDTKGYPPSIREIATEVGLKSSSSVHNILKKLENMNLIERDATKPRAISIVDENKNFVDIPLIGRVAAGEPIFAEENIEDWLSIPNYFISSGEHFLLRVKGESMVNAGIFDNDIVLVRQQNIAENHSIVVALIDESATIKTFFKSKNNLVILQPENDSLEPKSYNANEILILGIVKAVFRKL